MHTLKILTDIYVVNVMYTIRDVHLKYSTSSTCTCSTTAYVKGPVWLSGRQRAAHWSRRSSDQKKLVFDKDNNHTQDGYANDYNATRTLQLSSILMHATQPNESAKMTSVGSGGYVLLHNRLHSKRIVLYCSNEYTLFTLSGTAW